MRIGATRPAAVLIAAAGLYVLLDPLAITPGECIRGLPAEPIQRVAICFSAPYAAPVVSGLLFGAVLVVIAVWTFIRAGDSVDDGRSSKRDR